MTQPDATPQVFEGTDIEVRPEDLEQPADVPATSDPEQTGDSDLGGTGGGAGGAG